MAPGSQYKVTNQQYPRPHQRNVLQKNDSKLGAEKQEATIRRLARFS
jgi:hypothetical protein